MVSGYHWASQLIPKPAPRTNCYSSAAVDYKDGLCINLEYSALPKSRAKL
jgi:hypothetical protein